MLAVSDDFRLIISKWSVLNEAFDNFLKLHMGKVDTVISVKIASMYLIFFMPSQQNQSLIIRLQKGLQQDRQFYYA